MAISDQSFGHDTASFDDVTRLIPKEVFFMNSVWPTMHQEASNEVEPIKPAVDDGPTVGCPRMSSEHDCDVLPPTGDVQDTLHYISSLYRLCYLTDRDHELESESACDSLRVLPTIVVAGSDESDDYEVPPFEIYCLIKFNQL